jgi:hypothetical protein
MAPQLFQIVADSGPARRRAVGLVLEGGVEDQLAEKPAIVEDGPDPVAESAKVSCDTPPVPAPVSCNPTVPLQPQVDK